MFIDSDIRFKVHHVIMKKQQSQKPEDVIEQNTEEPNTDNKKEKKIQRSAQANET